MFISLSNKKDIQGKELENKLNLLFKEEKFNTLFYTMQKFGNFKLKDLIPYKSYSFEATVVKEDEKVETVQGTVILLTNAEQNIRILYNEIPSAEDHYFGNVLEKDSKNILYNIRFDNNKINVSQASTELINLTYEVDADLTDINAKDLPFCIPGYQHCGPGCGYGKTFGGGPPINETDSCCVSHDRCWDNFGSWDPCCDKALLDCIQGHGTNAAALIRATFYANSKKCK